MRLIRCLPLLATLALAACEGTTLPPLDTGVGALHFRFSGDLAGSFDAVGAAEPTPSTTHAWAYADLDATHWVTVTAYRPHADGNGGDLISFAFPLVDGARVFDWADCDADAACPGGSVFFRWGAHPMPETEGIYNYSSGLIHITSVSGDRIRGSFTGTAHGVSAGGGPLSLSDGSFDLPLRRPPFEVY